MEGPKGQLLTGSPMIVSSPNWYISSWTPFAAKTPLCAADALTIRRARTVVPWRNSFILERIDGLVLKLMGVLVFFDEVWKWD
jgi:hypothetical protein